MAIFADGRMIRKDISKSIKFEDLSKESIVLFFMLIPHYSSHGKLNGEAAFIKGEIVPRIKWFTIPLIEKCLKEINDKTNVKWFEFEGLNYIHSLNWFKHQKLDKNKIGTDKLPTYSGVTQELVTHKVEVKVEVEEEVKDKEEIEAKGSNSGFDKFWEAYPKKQGKSKAIEAWKRLEASDDLLSIILRALALQSSGPQWQKDAGQFIPFPATWLNQKRWEDQIEVITKKQEYFAPAQPINQFDTSFICGVNCCQGRINMDTRSCSLCDTNEYQPAKNQKIEIKFKSI